MSEPVKYFAPITLATKRTIAISTERQHGEPPIEADISLKWADGMIGVIPMFDNLADAQAYAGPTGEIMVFEGPTLKDADNVEKAITD